MAIIVQHKISKNYYILLGASFSYFRSSKSRIIGGNLLPYHEEGECQTIAVSDAQGEILWLPSKDLSIIKIDEASPGSILQNFQPNSEKVKEEADYDELCPGCGEKVTSLTQMCPACGLTLILEESQ